jgi:GTP-binding protein
MKPSLYQNAEFLTSAAKLTQLPLDEGFEVAFAGRSNAGKSSALNALTKQHRLARTSKTPGRTQLINLFKLDADRRLVDLPGYGYARVSHETKERWQETLAQYLRERLCLKGLILLSDIRHPLQPTDETLVDWARDNNLPVHILLSKSDKLNRGPAKTILLTIRKECQQRWGNAVTAQTFSSLKNEGLDELVEQLNQWYQLVSNSTALPDTEPPKLEP